MNYLDGIQRFASYVENNIEDPIDIDEAISTSYISKFHFYRIFKAVIGLSIQEYIINRKISRAAYDLLHTNQDVLSIAVKYGYRSHEVFTRNFRKIYHCTPAKYRKQPGVRSIHKSSLIDIESIEMKIKSNNGKVMISENIEVIRNLKLVGIVRDSHDNNVSTISGFIEEFLKQANLIQNISQETLYRVCYDVDISCEVASFKELIAVEVDELTDVPNGMIGKRIDDLKVLTYTHKGILGESNEEKLLSTYHFIYGYRIPAMGYELTNEMLIEKYGDEFNGPSEDSSRMEVSITIK